MKEAKSWLLFVVTVGIIALYTVGCAPKPNTVANELLDSLKKGDYTKAQQYTIAEQNGLVFDKIKENQASVNLYNKIFSNLEYNILDTTVDQDKATVKLKTTNLDMDKISKEATTEALSKQMANAFAGTGKELTEDEIIQMFIERMEDPAAQKVIMENNIELKKDPSDKKWKVVNNADFTYTVTGNFGKSMNNNASQAPEAEEDPNAPGSRSNPIKMGEAGVISVTSYSGNQRINYQLSFTVKNIIRGDEAWQLIQKENMFNDPPPEGKEYMLVRASATVTDADSIEHPYNIYEGDFDFVSKKGMTYEHPGVVTPDPFQAELYKGGSSEGNIAALVDIGDEMDMKYDNIDRALWFSLK